MGISEYNNHAMQNLVLRWNNVAENNVDPSECSELIAETEQVAAYLEGSGATQISREKIGDLSRALLKAYGTLDNPKVFAQWFSLNSTREAKPRLNEACKSLHHLFTAVAQVNNAADSFGPIDSADGDQIASQGLITFAGIDSEAKSHIEKPRNGMLSYLPIELFSSIYEGFSLEDLFNMRGISEHSREQANFVIIDRLNKGEISFSDLNIVTQKDAFSFFGERAADIICFGEADPTNPDADIKVLCLDQLSGDQLIAQALGEESAEMQTLAKNILINKLNTGKFSFSELNIITKTDLNYVFGERSSEIIHLEVKNARGGDKIKDTLSVLSIAQLAAVKELELPAFYDLERGMPLQDISALRFCPLLKTLFIRHTNYTDISVLKHCPALKYLDISYCDELSDISVLSHCPNLKVLFMSNTKVKDIKVLDGLTKLEKVNRFGCEISDEDLQPLRDRNIEIQ